MTTKVAPDLKPEHPETDERPSLVPLGPMRSRTSLTVFDDPTQGRNLGSDPYDDPTQGRKIGSDPYDDPTRAR